MARPGVALREAAAGDLDFVMQTERQPGFERLTACWTRAEHMAALARADTRYVIGGWPGGPSGGFAILQPFNDVHEGAKLKRIAVAHPGSGLGQPFLVALLDWVFASSDCARVWLDVFTHNERARHVYRRVGFSEDGALRQAYRMPDGSRADRVIMSVLRDEWRAR